MDSSQRRTSFCRSNDPSGSRNGRNSMVDNIKKMKEKRLKMLDDYSSGEELELIQLLAQAQEKEKKKRPSPKGKKKSDAAPITPPRRSERIRSQVTPVPVVHVAPKIKVTKKPVKRAPVRAPVKAPVKTPVRPRVRKAKSVAAPPKKKRRVKSKYIYGPLPGIEIGDEWNSRLECSHAGVHRPTIAGIHPGPLGAYSVALSGGYPEDVDDGNLVIFSGAGGRNLKGNMGGLIKVKRNAQIKDQVLTSANLSLIKNMETGVPLRLIRGHKVGGFFAPKQGYRYDGLYRVIQYCYCTGDSGFRVFRFMLFRIYEQKPAPYNVFPRTDIERPSPRILLGKYGFCYNFLSSIQLDKRIDQCIDRMCRISRLKIKGKRSHPYRGFEGWKLPYIPRDLLHPPRTDLVRDILSVLS